MGKPLAAVGLADQRVGHILRAGARLGEMDRRVEIGGRPAHPVALEGRSDRGDGAADQDPQRQQDDDDLDQRDSALPTSHGDLRPTHGAMAVPPDAGRPALPTPFISREVGALGDARATTHHGT